MKHSVACTWVVVLAALGASLLFGAVDSHAATSYHLKSPDGKVALSVLPGERLQYAVTFHGRQVIEPSALGIVVDGQDLGQQAAFSGKPATLEVNEHYPTRGVHSLAINHYRSAVLALSAGAAKTAWQLEVRVFNDGVAYRYRVPGSGQRRINGESSEWAIPVGTTVWHQSADNRSYEARYNPDIVGQMPQGLKLMAPASFQLADGAGYGMMTEANLVGYSDMALQVAGPNGFKAIFQDDAQGWNHQGEIVSPWRVTMLSADLKGLVNSDLVKNLCPAPAPQLAGAKWIRPGRSIWHWLTGGEPKLEEQKAWVDGTAQLGHEYYLVDDGWRKWNGGGDNAWSALEDIVKYARAKHVDIWAWVDSKYVFTPADREAYFKRVKSIGIVGLKIDFPRPANVEWVRWYDDVLRDAAAAELMIDFHGAVKPTGRERTWPNEMTREGICGREQGKNPASHDTALPFVRFVQGHADYTPTLLIPNRLNGSSFAHELAMAIVFTSPYMCLGDNPKHYLESDAADVLKALPAVWDETIVLPGSDIGRLAGFARRQGDQWFIGVINGSTPARRTVALSFLGRGNYKLVELADSPDRPDAFVRVERTVTRKDVLTLPLRRDGGYIAWLRPEGAGR